MKPDHIGSPHRGQNRFLGKFYRSLSPRPQNSPPLLLKQVDDKLVNLNQKSPKHTFNFRQISKIRRSRSPDQAKRQQQESVRVITAKDMFLIHKIKMPCKSPK